MLDVPSSPLPWPKLTHNPPLENLHHKSKQIPRQRCIPPPLARLVPDKRVLCLHLEKLWGRAINLKSCMTVFWTHRTSDVGVFQRLTDKISPRTGNMRVLFAKDHLQR